MKRAVQSVLMLVLVAVIVPRALGQEHPVPLEKNIDAAKCLQCHENKTKGKVVHAAMGKGCLACHLVRQNGDSTRVTLRNGRPATLCFSCHANKQPLNIQGHIHSPAQSDCLKCHNPHSSENEKLLRQPLSGGKGENLCLTCHWQGAKVPAAGSRHPALDMGCGTCHVNHKAGQRGKQEFDFHLAKATPALCLDCHDVKDAKLAEAHHNQPFENADCVQCHDPHQSKSPKLLQAFLHQPFQGGCDTCHQPAKDGKVVLTQADSNALCASCHDAAVKKIANAKVPHAGAQGDCVACHDPHAGKSARFMKPNPVAACTACHSEQAEMLAKKPVLHDPAFNQRCSICHEAHGGDRPRLLRADIDTLCLTCHGPNTTLATKGGDDAIFGNAVLLPADYMTKVPRVNPQAGHPVPAHPTAGADPRDKAKTITCVTCHDPHAGVAASRLVSTDGSVRAMCQQCHAQQKEQ